MFAIAFLILGVLSALSGADPWIAAPVTVSCFFVAVTSLLRRNGLSWSSLLGGFRRDR